MLSVLHETPPLIPLEEHYHLPPEPRERRRIDKSALAELVDARLVIRAGLEARLERAQAAIARALLDARAWEHAGYSTARDYAREELGLSLRSLQDLARLDRDLSRLPRLDAAITSGRLSRSRAILVLPMATPETEVLWLRIATRFTCDRIRRIVQSHREQQLQSVATMSAPSPSPASWAPTGPPSPREDVSRSGSFDARSDEAEVVILQRKPPRSQILWEAFVDEASREAGHPLTQAQALETLLAEFRTLLPPEIAASVRQTPDGPVCGGGPAVSAGSSGPIAPLSMRADPVLRPVEADDLASRHATAEDAAADRPAPIAWEDQPDSLRAGELAFATVERRGPSGGTSFILRRSRGQWRRELREAIEGDPDRPAVLDAADRRALDHAAGLIAQGYGADLSPEDTRLLDRDQLDRQTPHELQQRFLSVRARLRRLAVDQGALLALLRNFQLYRALLYADFGSYARDRAGISRRTAEIRADRHRALLREPILHRAWMRDELCDSHLEGFRRLLRCGLEGGRLRPWLDRARHTTVSTFLEQVRWLEAAREGWWEARQRAWSGVRSGDAAPAATTPCPTEPPGYFAWCRLRRELNERPDLLAWLATGWQISARGALAPAHGLDPRALRNPLVPSLAEPATRLCRLYAPASVARDYLDALGAVRAMYGRSMPAWWCLEVMILHVRRDWACAGQEARARTEHYEIFARDGFRCTSPGCRSRRHLQAHHIRFRSDGGSDDPSNLTTLCAACHQFALHRAGTLRVYGRAPNRLVWERGRIEASPSGDAPRPDRRALPWQRFLGEFRRERSGAAGEARGRAGRRATGAYRFDSSEGLDFSSS